MATAAETLAKVPLFTGLDRKGMRELEGSAREVHYKAGAAVTHEGQMGAGFFVVQEGELVVKVNGLEVRRLHAGEYFGEMALIDESSRSAEVSAVTEVTCLGFASWAFRPFAEAHPSVAWALLETMVRRVREAEERAGGSA